MYNLKLAQGRVESGKDFLKVAYESGNKDRAFDQFAIVRKMRAIVEEAIKGENITYREAFDDLDEGMDNRLDNYELFCGMQKLGLFVEMSEIDSIVYKYGAKSGALSFNQFLDLLGVDDPDRRNLAIRKGGPRATVQPWELTEAENAEVDELAAELREFIAKRASQEDFDVYEMFEQKDYNQSGRIDVVEFMATLRSIGIDADELLLRRLLARLAPRAAEGAQTFQPSNMLTTCFSYIYLHLG